MPYYCLYYTIAGKIDFATFDIRTGTSTLTLPAGKWLVTAVANVLTSATGSFSTDVSWLGRTQLFQGYRTSNQNRNQACLTWAVILDVSTSTTYPINFSGSGAEVASRQWTAIKISN